MIVKKRTNALIEEAEQAIIDSKEAMVKRYLVNLMRDIEDAKKRHYDLDTELSNIKLMTRDELLEKVCNSLDKGDRQR